MKVWTQTIDIGSRDFVCGFCGNLVASSKGYYSSNANGRKDYGSIYLCPHCKEPNYFDLGRNIRIPNEQYGKEVNGVTDTNLYSLYTETRNCYKNSCYNASIMISRKMISHIAVERGADEGKRFIEYVDYLSDEGYLPPNGKDWVDQIRVIGNEANHEISLKEESEAKKLIKFIEMLLRFIYEFPSMI